MCTHRHLGAEVIDKLVCGGAVSEFEVKPFGHRAHVNYILGRVVVDHLVVVVVVAVVVSVISRGATRRAGVVLSTVSTQYLLLEPLEGLFPRVPAPSSLHSQLDLGFPGVLLVLRVAVEAKRALNDVRGGGGGGWR